MSNPTQHLGWWMASDGKWYPPELHPDAAGVPSAPLDTGRPASSEPADEAPPAPGWWVASDGMWYPPELHPLAEAPEPESPAPAPPPAADAVLVTSVGDTDPMETPVVHTVAAAEPDLAADVADYPSSLHVEAEASSVGPDELEFTPSQDEFAGGADDFSSVAELDVGPEAESPSELEAEAEAEAASESEAEAPSESEAEQEPESESESESEQSNDTTLHPAKPTSAFSSSDWLPGGPFGVDVEKLVRPEVAGRPGRRRRRKH